MTDQSRDSRPETSKQANGAGIGVDFGGRGTSQTDGTIGRAMVIHPVLPPDQGGQDGAELRVPEARLEEAVGLALAIELDVVFDSLVRVNRPQPSTLLGGGAIEDLSATAEAVNADLLVVDAALTPVQQRNLERRVGIKVIDRTALILEIFGKRARTKEGQLQVELAHLTYQRSRLVRSWTHLERQRGGAGFMGGPGESQIELDRRLIDDRIVRLKRDLDQVRRTRGLHRGARERVPYPVVALVGYTNAGKSTLFNRLTESDVMAKDLLFATLDPTMRAIDLTDGVTAILSDTVGFISDLPTHLVAAFRATLEEVEAADLVLHVRDIAHRDSAAQAQDVKAVLGDLGIDVETDTRVLEIHNKIDLLADARTKAEAEAAAERTGAVPVSAWTGEGMERLRAAMRARLTADHQVIDVDVDLADGRTIAWLHERGRVLDHWEKDEPGRACYRVSLDPVDVARLEQRLDRPLVDALG